MGVYVDEDPFNDALLNSLGPFDAIVMAGVTASGRIYPTVADAITAGHKAIGVQDGAYAAGFTLSGNGYRIVGIDRPVGGTTVTSGPRFGGEIIIESSYCTIENLGVTASAGNGIQVTAAASHVLIRDCHVGSPAAQGIWIRGGLNVVVDHCILVGGTVGDNGILVTPSSASGTWDTVIVRDCWFWDWLGSGIQVNNAGSDTTVARYTHLLGNTIRNVGKSWGSGIVVQSHQIARVIGNSIFTCGAAGVNDASGIRIETPSTSPRAFSVVTGNQSYGNRGYGISLGAANDDVVVAGNIVLANGIGQYQNCSSCPGYASGNTNLL